MNPLFIMSDDEFEEFKSVDAFEVLNAGARVVGEPSHGSGTVPLVKIRNAHEFNRLAVKFLVCVLRGNSEADAILCGFSSLITFLTSGPTTKLTSKDTLMGDGKLTLEVGDNFQPSEPMVETVANSFLDDEAKADERPILKKIKMLLLTKTLRRTCYIRRLCCKFCCTMFKLMPVALLTFPPVFLFGPKFMISLSYYSVDGQVH